MKETALTTNISDLLNEVRQLRDDTDSLVCNCNQPDCPFQESKLLNIKHIECSFDFHADSRRLRRKESPPLKGIERRSDGTIVERDGPRTTGEDSLEKRLMKSNMYSSYNYGLCTHLSVSTLSDSEDCLVDSDNLFGISSDDDSTFSRFEPTRKHVRRSNSRSPKLQKRRATLIPASSTFPTSHMDGLRKSSQGLHQTLADYLRNETSLLYMARLEDDEECLSTCSSSLKTRTQLPCHAYSQQHNELYWE